MIIFLWLIAICLFPGAVAFTASLGRQVYLPRVAWRLVSGRPLSVRPERPTLAGRTIGGVVLRHGQPNWVEIRALEHEIYDHYHTTLDGECFLDPIVEPDPSSMRTPLAPYDHRTAVEKDAAFRAMEEARAELEANERDAQYRNQQAIVAQATLEAAKKQAAADLVNYQSSAYYGADLGPTIVARAVHGSTVLPCDNGSVPDADFFRSVISATPPRATATFTQDPDGRYWREIRDGDTGAPLHTEWADTNPRWPGQPASW